MRTKRGSESGVALTITLVLVALVVIVVVAYLVSTRIERSTSSVHANRLRAKIVADSGLTAALHLLRDNTRYGNYLTAMPPPSPSSASIYTEVYRPADPADSTHAVKADDYLRLDNAAGEILVSRATAGSSAGPDPRPTPESIPSLGPSSPFALTAPNLSSNNSYDFNQTVTVGSSTSRLVQPSPTSSPGPPPAYGQWVTVRNNAITPEVIGRYAFYVEDESMKLNVNVAGNSLASPSPSASPNLRVNDLAPFPATTPASQIQEIDPTAVLPSANRRSANIALTTLGNPGARLASALTIGFLSNWITPTNYAHLLTTVSKDDNTTAKGWPRIDLNALVAGSADKLAAATTIANWIRDAWTGTPIASLQNYQIFGDDRLRKQIAANIVDYIDGDNIPTDMGDIVPTGFTDPVPVIGIEKIPYLAAIEVIYQASNSTCPSPIVPGTYTASIRLKIQFRFLNLFETALDPKDSIGQIQITGVPVVSKNGSTVLDIESQTFTINLSDLKPPTGMGNCSTAGICSVPAGIDGTASSGAKTLQTDWLTTQPVTFTVVTNDAKPRLLSGKIITKVFGKHSERLDDTVVVTNLTATGYKNSSGNSVGDFLTDSATTPLQIASINVAYGYGGAAQAGDPRYRGRLVNDRWRNLDRTDATTPTGSTPDRVTAFIDTAEVNPRAYGADWYDEAADRPLAFIRNGPMANIGELGHIAATEYQWRTLYLQHPERPANTSQMGPKDEIPLRRSTSQDYILLDLFRVGGSTSRTGAININTQQQFFQTGASFATLPLQSLFVGVPVGTPAPTVMTQAAPAAAAPSPADRMSTSVNLLVNSTTTAASSGTGTNPVAYRVASIANKRSPLSGETATADNNPPRPYFQAGELASTLSRLLSASEASDTSGSSSRSKVVYSALRTDPQSTTTKQNYRKDYQVEQAFREVSNSITTRGNVFRVLYVGQALKNGVVQAEYLGEAFVERQRSNPGSAASSDSTYRILTNRVITE